MGFSFWCCRLGGWVSAKAVLQKGFRCVFSNQGFWYLDRLDPPWDDYKAELLEGNFYARARDWRRSLHVGRDS